MTWSVVHDDRRHGRDAEPLVDHRTAGVVDAGHDPLDAEGLAGDASRHDVRVVAARHRGEGPRVGDARLHEDVAVEAEPDDRGPAEALRQAAERLAALVDDRDRVAALLQQPGQLAADAAAAHDDDVHDAPIGKRAAECADVSEGAPAVTIWSPARYSASARRQTGEIVMCQRVTESGRPV